MDARPFAPGCSFSYGTAFNGCSLVIVGEGNEARGLERTISDYDGVTGTFTLEAAPAGSPDINEADSYEAGELSSVPAYLRPAYQEYALFQVFSVSDVAKAPEHMQEYRRQIESVNERFASRMARAGQK